MNRQEQIQALEKEWRENPRWSGITRPYSAEEVLKTKRKIQARLYHCYSNVRVALEKAK